MENYAIYCNGKRYSKHDSYVLLQGLGQMKEKMTNNVYNLKENFAST